MTNDEAPLPKQPDALALVSSFGHWGIDSSSVIRISSFFGLCNSGSWSQSMGKAKGDCSWGSDQNGTARVADGV